MEQPRIVVVGSSSTDIAVVSERLPSAGETVIGGELLQAGGGKGANQAVAARWALCAAALSTERKGAQSSMPTRAAIERELQKVFGN